MIYSIFIATVLIICVIGQNNNNLIRNFAPSVPPGKYSSDRIWMQLSQLCFAEESSVKAFTNFLLAEYPCISFDNTRPEIYSYDTFWSLWFEKSGAFPDFSCLNAPIILPTNIKSSCVDYIYYESILAPMQINTYDCTDKAASDPLWSLDILDGSFYDSKYDYPYWGDLDTVEVIVLDTDIYTGHTEFSESNPECLSSNPFKCWARTQDHGTHVAATIVGKTVGGAKKTKLWYYPVCKPREGCRQRDIEDGYELAIKHMNENPSKAYVINFSVGGLASDADKVYYDAIGIKILKARGVWVVSAGNEDINACDVAPAFTEYAITVGAYDKYRKRAWFSNWGECVDFYAPGVDIYSAFPSDNGYVIKSGTSMASPNIASIIVNFLKRLGEYFWRDIDTEYEGRYWYIRYQMTGRARCLYDATLTRHGLPVIDYDHDGNSIFTQIAFTEGVSMIQPFSPFCTYSKVGCPIGSSTQLNSACGKSFCGCINSDGTLKIRCDDCCTDEYNEFLFQYIECGQDSTKNCGYV